MGELLPAKHVAPIVILHNIASKSDNLNIHSSLDQNIPFS